MTQVAYNARIRFLDMRNLLQLSAIYYGLTRMHLPRAATSYANLPKPTPGTRTRSLCLSLYEELPSLPGRTRLDSPLVLWHVGEVRQKSTLYGFVAGISFQFSLGCELILCSVTHNVVHKTCLRTPIPHKLLHCASKFVHIEFCWFVWGLTSV